MIFFGKSVCMCVKCAEVRPHISTLNPTLSYKSAGAASSYDWRIDIVGTRFQRFDLGEILEGIEPEGLEEFLGGSIELRAAVGIVAAGNAHQSLLHEMAN